MCDGKYPLDGAAEAFAAHVGEWLDEFTPLIDALVILRQHHELMAALFLLSVSPLSAFWESWELWGLWADAEPVQIVDRLEPFLGARRAHRLRYALWGARPGDGVAQ